MSARSLARLVLAIALLSLAAGTRTPAVACGHCEEDVVAATYDYGVLTRAIGQRHVVVYARMLGPVAGASPALAAAVRQTIVSIAGVDHGTVRVSLDPPAAAFACDAWLEAPRTLIDRINRRLVARRIQLTPVRIESRMSPMPKLELARHDAAVAKSVARTR